MRPIALSGVLSVLVLAGSSGCDRSGTQVRAADGELRGRLTITGSSTVAPLVGEIARRFEGEHPGVRIEVQTGGSSRGMADARRGIADIGMVSRALRPDETDLTGYVIARDGITLIVHRDNPVRTLTHDQIVDVFTGRTRRWSEVGGRDAPITVVNKADGRSTLDLFLDHFHLRSEDIRASVVIGDNPQGIRSIAGDPDAIGYVSIGTAVFETSRETAIRMLPLAGVEPTLDGVRDGSFPLYRPLNLVTHGEPGPLAHAFLAFAASHEIHELVEAQYFVPILE